MNRFLLFLFFFGCLVSAQHQDKVDFIDAKVFITPNPDTKSIQGSVFYEFKVLEDVDFVFLDAKNMEFSSVQLNTKKVKYEYDGNKISFYRNFKEGKFYTIKLEYSCTPKQTVYFSGWDDAIDGNEQIWTQGQGKYTSHWLPSFDSMEEKVDFDVSLSVKKPFFPLVNGQLVNVKDTRDGSLVWEYEMQKPMSSYLLAFAVGYYEEQKIKSKSGIPIQNYYYPKDSLKVEPTYRYTKEIFDFLEKEIGVPYPWQNYKQIPVHDFLYAGMENTTATIFSDGYVIDSTAFVDKNYVNVNAHELAHQWFGNLVTEKDSNHHWLHEGFATYYAYLAEKEIFGEEHFYWKLRSSLKQLQTQVNNDEGQSLLDPKASSLTFYEKGAWALFMLRNEVGDENFKAGIKNYLIKYLFKNVTVANFLKEMEIVSGHDLSDFRKQWLDNTALPFEKAKNLLDHKSESVKLAFELDLDLVTFQKNTINYEKYWDATNSVHLKKQILEVSQKYLPQEIVKAAIESDTIPIRQMIARNIDSIPLTLKGKFESLLEDDSYVTIENALFKLWVTYPEEKAKYLEKTKDVIGLPNKNVRLLWLTLAILTNDYDGRNTQVYYKELSSYTSNEHSWEIRMGAFQFLNQAIGLDNESLRNLVNASVHHSWQFKKFARNLLTELLKDEEYKVRLIEIAKGLQGSELAYINIKLKE